MEPEFRMDLFVFLALHTYITSDKKQQAQQWKCSISINQYNQMQSEQVVFTVHESSESKENTFIVAY